MSGGSLVPPPLWSQCLLLEDASLVVVDGYTSEEANRAALGSQGLEGSFVRELPDSFGRKSELDGDFAAGQKARRTRPNHASNLVGPSGGPTEKKRLSARLFSPEVERAG